MNSNYLFQNREEVRHSNSESLRAGIITVKNAVVLPYIFGHNDSGGVCNEKGEFLR